MLLESFLVDQGLTESWGDPSLFVHWRKGLVTLINVYVYYLMLTGIAFIKAFTDESQMRFTVRICTDLGKFLRNSISKT